MSRIIIIIPARGGSKGIPRKNLRPLLGKPLIYYSIQNGLNLKNIFDIEVVLTSDDNEILTMAEKLGATTVKRSQNLADDITTLDPVIQDALVQSEKKFNKIFDVVITLQPTSPLLSKESLVSAIENFECNPQIDTIISAIDDTHLSWRKEDDKFNPNFEKRLNRQFLPKNYKETGAFLITRRNLVTEQSRIGKNVDLFILPYKESIDIDTHEDWNISEYLFKRKTVLFVVSGYHEIGLGHVYNSLSIAHEIMDHEVVFLVDSKSELAYKKIASFNYKVFIQKEKDIVSDIIDLHPDVVINDMLDTSSSYIKSLKSYGLAVVNIEDLGDGARLADLVINAMYPEKKLIPNHYFGAKYFILRDEFLFSELNDIKEKPTRILLSFGGVDPNNLTLKVLESVYDWCISNKITIEVIIGPGYCHVHTLKGFKEIVLHKNIPNISDFMANADVVFTSGGRTTFEVASVGTPTIVIAQNDRELTHFFCSAENGFIHLGLGNKTEKKKILDTLTNLVGNFEQRKFMQQQMLANDLKGGKSRVVNLIKKIIETEC